jgi:5-(carboxyamino)imidazole ribonucleotide mutase
MALVYVVTGSKNDEVLIEPGLALLKELGISYEYSVISAHRSPDKLRALALELKDKGVQVIIAAAGAAAHLPGVMASWTTLPVIGVPLATSELKGIDSLYSIVQMPAGVPVACMGVGVAGVKNAALLAAQILGVKHENISAAFAEYKRKLSI